MNMANDQQNHLAKYTKEFKIKTRPEDSNFKRVIEDVLNSAMAPLKGREMVFKAFESRIFLKSEESEQSDQSSSYDKYTSLKLDNDLNTSGNKSHTSFSSDSTPKHMLQRLPIALTQVKAGGNSENLLNGIRRIVYSLDQSKEITKKGIQ